MKKIRIGILFGGQSAEHEVSIRSAKNVYDALDKSKYEPILIGISKKGDWLTLTEQEFRKYNTLPSSNSEIKNNVIANLHHYEVGSALVVFQNPSEILNQVQDDGNLDVVFPILHGPNGEDGTVQGMLKLFNIPFVGAGVLGSAVGMDKDVTKRLLRDGGLPIARFIVATETNKDQLSFVDIKKQLGLPFFVKPANLGSSVGVSKVHTEKDFGPAIEKAFKHDRKILIEEGINAREIECAVLGNNDLKSSILGEIIPHHEFYDYDAKYIDEDGAALSIPAKLTEKQTKEIQDMAIKTCEVLCVQGMARVDFFVDKMTEKIYVNEVNTIPGFTSISMYPKLWEASGLSYPELIDKLISLALETH